MMKYALNGLIIGCLSIFACTSSPGGLSKEVTKVQIAELPISAGKMNNPALMSGSTFGNYFQSLYKLGRYEDMLRFTSTELIAKHGRDKLLETYKKMNFAFDIKLKSMYPGPDSTIDMNYETVQFATRRMLRIGVKIEQDTVRLVSGDFFKF